MNISRTVLLLGSALIVAACSRSEAPESVASPAPATEAAVAEKSMPVKPEANSATAVATLNAIGDSGAGGELRFTAIDGTVLLGGTITGLKPGSSHGFHLHENGDCSAPDASSAGGHFNPGNTAHGYREAEGAHHAGDVPNQNANNSGEVTVNERLDGLEISTGSTTDIIGRSVIVHAKQDDYFTQPSGDAGDRIACGVIVADSP